ncbi:M1 family aminopeptidase [Pseudoalteromonas sp. T1lg65]|uniref:M1 family aminopeptidase n=1 Tax=Pseudoalteromonas sp. T1lg65 TaxID=2077101 RepID=UPI003F79BBB4
MLLKMMFFELRYYLRQPSFYIVSLLLFTIAFMASVTDNISLGGNNTNINSPYSIMLLMSIMSLFSLFIVVNFVANSALKNDLAKMSELVLSRPISLPSYYLGSFLGSYMVTVIVFSTLLLGIWLGSSIGQLLNLIPADMVGEHKLSYYLTPFLLLAMPTLFTLSAIMFAVGQKLRSMMACYVVAVVSLITYLISGNLIKQLSSREVAGLLDVFASRTAGLQTQYWSALEKNSMVIELTGSLLYNRIFWLLVALAVLTYTLLTASREVIQRTKKAKVPDADLDKANALTFNFAVRSQGLNTFAQYMSRTRFEVSQVLKSYSFVILVFLSLTLLVTSLFSSSGAYDTTSWPLTYAMVELVQGSLSLLAILIVVYYSGELVWRDRDTRMSDIIDAYPTPNWVFWSAKYSAAAVVLVLLCVAGSLLTIGFQFVKGIEHIELKVYFITLTYFYVFPMLFLLALAFLLQTICPNKFMGMGLFVLFYIVSLVMTNFGFDHPLWRFSDIPSVQYSDINLYGSFLTRSYWFLVYWAGLSICFATLAYGLLPRGAGIPLRARFKLLPHNLGRNGIVSIVVGLSLFVGSGAFIYKVTTIDNKYMNVDGWQDIAEQYEREYVQYKRDPVPTPVRVHLDADLYPKERRIEASLTMTVKNTSDRAIERFLVKASYETELVSVNIPGGKLGQIDSRFNMAWFEFEQPMAVGETRQATIEVKRGITGFVARGYDKNIVGNGLFIDNLALFPQFGYSSAAQLRDKSERRKRQLPELEPANKIDDTLYLRKSAIGESEIMFSAKVTTDADQIAMVPGYLINESVEGERRTFEYQLQSPMKHYYSILSFELEVHRERYKNINIEVYYHPNHHWNIEHMVESVKDSIDYYSEAFGPYQYRQLRIVEVPRYHPFAQSFANTVPYSESMGFITDTRDEADVNYPYYVTAHEVAHQWFGHQVDGADVEGAAVISETLSQYAAIMVLKKKCGEQNLRKFLKHELDTYLQGRTQDSDGERPLGIVLRDQQYAFYSKGSVVMMALHDMLGEKHINDVLRNFIVDFDGESIYPTTRDLVARLTVGLNEQKVAFIRDQFEKITFYDLRLTEFEVSNEPDEQGNYLVTLKVYADKLYASEDGAEIQAALQQQIDIGLFFNDPSELNEQDNVIYLQKHQLENGENTIEITTSERPNFAGVDPFVKLVDKKSSDNIKSL